MVAKAQKASKPYPEASVRLADLMIMLSLFLTTYLNLGYLKGEQ